MYPGTNNTVNETLLTLTFKKFVENIIFPLIAVAFMKFDQYCNCHEYASSYDFLKLAIAIGVHIVYP